MDGKFTLVAKEGETLVFSFIGYVSEEVVVGAAQSAIKMVLNPDLIGLDGLW
jgi:iron complex outermembrane receptor protein